MYALYLILTVRVKEPIFNALLLSLGPDDMVQCALCYGKLQGWEQGDNPLREHARHFSSCPKFGDRKAVNASSLVNVHHTQGKALTLGRG